jgi:hypothetical protein
MIVIFDALQFGEREHYSYSGVTSVRWTATHFIVDYFDGEFSHTLNIPLIALYTFEVLKG